MKLFVANTSKLVQEINYRVAGIAKTFTQTIQPGQQVVVYDTPTATESDLRHIIEQLEVYGARPMERVTEDKYFSGLCYSFDKPVDVEAITEGLESNDTFVEEAAQESRKASAAAVNDTLQKMSGGKVKEVETQVQEQPKEGSTKEPKQETIKVKN